MRCKIVSRALNALVIAIMLLAPNAAAAATKITVAGWGSQQVYQQVVDAFEAAHPEIDVDLQLRSFGEHHEKLVVEMSAGVAPDVFLLSWAYFLDFVVPGSLTPLDSYIERDGKELAINDYFPPAIADSQYRGSQYGLPWLIGGQPMYYNIDLLANSGLANPKAGWTWSQWLDLARVTTRDINGDGVREQLGFTDWNHYENWATMIFSHGGQLFNEDRTRVNLDSPQVRKTFQFISDYVNQYRIVPGGGKETGSFQKGNITFNLNAPTQIANLSKATFNWGIAVPPKGDVKQVMIGGNLPLVIWSGSKQKEAAWKFVKFAASPEMEAARAHAGYSPPGRRSTYGIIKNAYLAYRELLMYQVPFTDMLYDEISGTVSSGLRDVVEQKQSIEAAILNMNNRLNAVLAERGLKR